MDIIHLFIVQSDQLHWSLLKQKKILIQKSLTLLSLSFLLIMMQCNQIPPTHRTSQVALHFFPASTARCLLEPWFRELGFIVCYGAIILKLYRHLVEFRTRKAHRWVLRDVDLLKYLSSMLFAVICYMSAFTASSIDLIQAAALDGLQEIQTDTCHQMKWEFVTQISEIFILAFGLHLAIASRNANTQFHVSSSEFPIAKRKYLN